MTWQNLSHLKSIQKTVAAHCTKGNIYFFEKLTFPKFESNLGIKKRLLLFWGFFSMMTEIVVIFAYCVIRFVELIFGTWESKREKEKNILAWVNHPTNFSWLEWTVLSRQRLNHLEWKEEEGRIGKSKKKEVFYLLITTMGGQDSLDIWSMEQVILLIGQNI